MSFMAEHHCRTVQGVGVAHVAELDVGAGLVSVPGFGFGVTPGPPDGVAAEMRDAEALGYDRMGVWDSPALFREPWMTLAAVARETSTLRLGTWVSNPVSRHPVVTASAIATLEDLAPGRTYFGIGSGGTGVWHLGQRAARLGDLREYVTDRPPTARRGHGHLPGGGVPPGVGSGVVGPDHHVGARAAGAAPGRGDRRRCRLRSWASTPECGLGVSGSDRRRERTPLAGRSPTWRCGSRASGS